MTENSKREQLHIVLKAIVLALLPILCAVLRCAMDGKTLFDVYLPSSPWNDELFYYKLTEGVVNFGFPQGYFGFNESHGLKLSFAAWSPVLLLFWVIWGLLFGWNLLSPILCNIALMSLTLFGFGILLKPSRKQIGIFTALFVAFTPMTRYLLCGMPEMQCFILLMWFFIAALHYEKRTGRIHWEIPVLFITVVLLTLMRPYFILLFLTPVAYFVFNFSETKNSNDTDLPTQSNNENQLILQKNWFFKLLLSGGIVGSTTVVYYVINHFFSAPYLTDLFYTDWLKAYAERGFAGGVKYTLWKLYTSISSIIGMMQEAVFGSGLASGALYLAYLMVMLIIFCYMIRGIRMLLKKKTPDQSVILYVQMFLAMLGFLVADLLMYRLTEGSKHLATFLAGAILLLAMTKCHELLPTGILLAAFLYLFVVKAHIPYDYAIPYQEAERVQQLESLKTQLTQHMNLADQLLNTPNQAQNVDTSELVTPNYDNTVIWSLWDQVEGETVTTDFGAYYMIPAGFGINLCDGGFMAAQFENLQSRYIATTPGGDIAIRCEAAGGVLIGSCDTLAVYDMRP